MFFNTLLCLFFCFVYLFSVLCILCFCSVLCIVSLYVYSCLFPIFAQVFRPLPPGGKLIAVNKYHIISYHIISYHIISYHNISYIISQLTNIVRATLYCLMSQCLLIYYVHVSYSIRKVYNQIKAIYSETNFK